VNSGGKKVTSEVTGDVIPLRASCTTIFPLASETKVVSTFSADMVVAEVVIESFGVGVGLAAVDPKTDQGRLVRGRRYWGWLLFGGGGGVWGGFDVFRLWGRRGGGCCGHESKRRRTSGRKGTGVKGEERESCFRFGLRCSWCLYNAR